VSAINGSDNHGVVVLGDVSNTLPLVALLLTTSMQQL